MFWDARGMQISAANLLLAGQQLRAPQQRTPIETPAKKEDFESLVFKSASTPSAPAANATAQSYGAAKPAGSQIDIRV
jgi:hypothetical protein